METKLRKNIKSYNPLRTYKTNQKYTKFLNKKGRLTDFLSEKIVKDFKYWRIIKDSFPYDRIATVHNLLIPKRVFSLKKDMNKKEAQELEKLFDGFLKEKYGVVLEKLSPKGRSVPTHYHIHLLKLKK